MNRRGLIALVLLAAVTVAAAVALVVVLTGGDDAEKCVGVWEKRGNGTRIRIAHVDGDRYAVSLVGGKNEFPAVAEDGKVVMNDVFGNEGVSITFRFDDESGTLRQGFPDGTEDTLYPVEADAASGTPQPVMSFSTAPQKSP